MNASPQILVLSSDRDNCHALISILQSEGWNSLQASRLSDCRELLARENVSLIFCERQLADGTYRDLLSIAQTPDRRLPVVVTSRLADWDEYLEALRHGAVDLIASPCKPNDVSSAIAQAQREDQALATCASSGLQKSTGDFRASSASGD